MDKKSEKVVVPLPKAKWNRSQSGTYELSEALEEPFARVKETSRPVTVMLLEIDDFGGFNKVFGLRRCGRMLEEVTSILKQSLRVGDLVTFYGKERFGLVLKGTHSQAASQVGRRIRSAIKEAAFAPEHGHVLKITVSCGHATQTNELPFETSDALIAAALECLREARESGQDRVVGYCLTPAALDFPEAEAKD